MTAPYHIAFVVEQALGHKTHGQNLQAKINSSQNIEARWVLPEWQKEGLAGVLPVYRNNWTLQSGWQARRGLAALYRAFKFDGLFFHTQVPAVLAVDWVRHYPSVISLDATPLQYDSLGDAYFHDRGPAWLENLKSSLNRRCFQAADHLVTWSQWAKDGLVTDYAVPEEKVTVISPGVDIHAWSPGSINPARNGRLKILFVGGDLDRKGGKTLLEAFRVLRSRTGDPENLELHLVSQLSPQAQKDLSKEPGVHLHLGLTPNSTELISLFHQADIFCLPTKGDCLPMVLAEAGAAGLPIISTRVGGISEIVKEGKNGFLIESADTRALVETMERLVFDPHLRRQMGIQSSQIVSTAHNTDVNARRLVEIMCEVIDTSQKRKKSI